MLMTFQQLADKYFMQKTTIKRMIQYYNLDTSASGKEIDETAFAEMLNVNDNTLRAKVAEKEVFTKEEIEEIFGCSLQQGMARSHRTDSLVLITDQYASDRVYGDYWEDDILYYTGMGLNGDQDFEFGQNKTLRDSTGKRMFIALFTKIYVDGKPRYIYRGEVELAAPARFSPTEEKDQSGNFRKVCQFPLRIKEKPVYTEEKIIEVIEEEQEVAEERLTRVLSPEKLRERAVEKGCKGTRSLKKFTAKKRKDPYKRSISVKNYALARAQGVCECCQQPGPFEVNGVPYLVCHHIKWLERGGDDTIFNTCGICPNCHDRVHILDLEEDTKTILKNMRADELKFSGQRI